MKIPLPSRRGDLVGSRVGRTTTTTLSGWGVWLTGASWSGVLFGTPLPSRRGDLVGSRVGRATTHKDHSDPRHKGSGRSPRRNRHTHSSVAECMLARRHVVSHLSTWTSARRPNHGFAIFRRKIVRRPSFSIGDMARHVSLSLFHTQCGRIGADAASFWTSCFSNNRDSWEQALFHTQSIVNPRRYKDACMLC